MTITETEQHITPKIGIIIPPPDVRNIVDRTAEFVARNGPDFEARVKLNESNNPKFNFLNPLDPYNAYYNQRVKQCLEGGVDLVSTKISIPTAMKLAQETPKAIQEVFEPKEAPAEFEFIVETPSIVGIELDIVKLTAQFVARNGRQFLTQLMNREQRNYLFDFLRPQHNMFSYFTKLVEQFTRILLPPGDIIDKLSVEARSPEIFMQNCKYRVAWDRYQARQRRREMEAEDKERQAYGQIDWHDFVVVEMVDYQQNEVGNFPPPTVPEEVGARTIAEERGELVVNRWVEEKNEERRLESADLDESDNDESDDEGEDEERVPAGPPPVSRETESGGRAAMKRESEIMEDDMEMSDDEDGDDEEGSRDRHRHTDIPAPPPLPPAPSGAFKQPPDASKPNLTKPDDVLIRPYDPKMKIKKPAEEVFLISPLGDNKKITSSQANKHIHVGLLNPSWKEHRDRNLRNRAQEDTTYASGNLVDLNLKSMAERRTDIFGTEETMIGRKVGEQDSGKEATERYIWDGRSTQHESLGNAAPRSSVSALDTATGAGSIPGAGIGSRTDATGTDSKTGLGNNKTDGASSKVIEIDQIGPQAVPQMAPPTITIIVNTPIVTTSMAAHIAPPPPPPPPPVTVSIPLPDDTVPPTITNGDEPVDKKPRLA